MKRFKVLLVICIIMLVSVILAAGCAAPSKPSAEEIYELTFACQHPPESSFTKAYLAWANWIEKESGGRIKITVLPAEQAAKATDHYDAAKNGVVDIACQLLPLNPGRWVLTEVVQLPLIFEFPGSTAAGLTALSLCEKYPEIQAEYEGVKILAFHCNGPAHIHTIKEPVSTLQDLKRMIVTTVGGEYAVESLRALGAVPETILPGEIYDALAKGVIDGDALEWEGQAVWNFYEHTNYSTEVGLFLSPFVHVMNQDTWNKLPPDLQELFTGEESVRRFSLALGYNFDKTDIVSRQKIDEAYKARGYPEVYVLPPEERAKWIEAVEPVREQWIKKATVKVGEAKARAILEDALKFAEQYKGYPDEVFPEGAEILREWGLSGY